jgi:hypothetical protein
MIENTRHIFNQKGIETEHIIISLARSIIEAEKGHINTVVGALKNDTPDLIHFNR